ncbi:hypothetical protein MRB53_042085 [Persea americana]|nr:hypothetical protein MRB53_042085 [Persea americana]
MNRECIYETIPASASRRRRNSQDDTTQSRKLFKKQAISPPEQSLADIDVLNVLESSVLTPAIWLELYDVFQLHYAADLPFLHPTLFKKPLRKAANPNLQDTKSEPIRPPGCAGYLLSFLTLTARFHPKLLEWQATDNESKLNAPTAISEYCYHAASSILNRAYFTYSGGQSIYTLQGMLMLSLYEWSSLKGARAWQRSGQAVRSAQAMGMQYDLDLDDEPFSYTMATAPERKVLAAGNRRNQIENDGEEEEDFVMQEIRRRTFWSCFIMDRYLSSGKHRPHLLHVQELRIQLPVSDQSFLFGEKATTTMLEESEADFFKRTNIQHENADVSSHQSMYSSSRASSRPSHGMTAGEQKIEVGKNEGNVSRFVRMISIYGRVVTWSCAGGRRKEKYPPWDQRSTWHNLERACHDFHVALPRQHTLSSLNIQAHIDQKTSGPYILIHVVWLLCQIILHREYIPFIPIACPKPEGPLDPPVFSQKDHNIPPGYWDHSARKVFQSAREIINLIQVCQECGHELIQTPIMAFAVYTVAFVGVYSVQFPWMDPDGYMCKTRDQKNAESSASLMTGPEATMKAVKVLGEMCTTLPMARRWSKVINQMWYYITKLKADYMASKQNGLTESTQRVGSTISLRAGGPGGGLSEYKLLEGALNEFGEPREDEAILTTSTDGSDARSVGSFLKSPGSMSRGDLESSVMADDNGATDDTVERVAREAGSTLPSPISANTSFEQLPPALRDKASVSPRVHEHTTLHSSLQSVSKTSALQVESPEAGIKQNYDPSATQFSPSQAHISWYRPLQLPAPYAEMCQVDGNNEIINHHMNVYDHPQNQVGFASAQMLNIPAQAPMAMYQQMPISQPQMWSPSYPWMPGVDLAAFTSGDEPAELDIHMLSRGF